MFLVTLKDDSDFEVCKVSAEIISKLKTCLLKYKLDVPLSAESLMNSTSTYDTAYVKEIPSIVPTSVGTTQNTVSHVIDEIVNSNDANLLATIYKNSMNMDGEATNEKEEEEEKALHYIPPVTRQDFLNEIFNTNIDVYIEEKNRWLKTYTSSFESILDDILTTYERQNVNSMDCY